MGRHLRAAEGGLIYHALNRANARLTIFADEDDYAAFDRALAKSVARHDIRLVAYKVLPNHFHLILWPWVNGELSRFMKWLTLTHTQRWHGHRHSAGTGTSTRAASCPSRSGTTATSSRTGGTWSATPCGLVW